MPVDVTKTRVHVRVLDPEKCEPKLIRYAKGGKGVTALKKKGVQLKVCCPKGKAKGNRCEVGMVTQAVVYDREKWSKSQAVKHAKRFKK